MEYFHINQRLAKLSKCKLKNIQFYLHIAPGKKSPKLPVSPGKKHKKRKESLDSNDIEGSLFFNFMKKIS